MNNLSTKRQQALEACEKVINGTEDGTITVSSSLLLCKRIARLVSDNEGQEWLNYEYGGYPNNNGIPKEAWIIGAKHGRLYTEKNEEGNCHEYLFTELCGELEATIDSNTKAINNFSTQGFSAAGEWAIGATNRMTSAVSSGTASLLKNIKTAERRLSILKSQYYDYAVRWQIELQFGNTSKMIFEEYQERVDGYYSLLPTKTLQKLNAIQDLMEDDNPEHYAQVVASCRRLWSETAKLLFDEVLPGYKGNAYKTKTGKDIDITGDHDNNKLSAVIETLQSKATTNTLVGSETVYLIDWIEQINKNQSAGVHHDVTREQAMRCIIHTYIALGDILSLKASVQE